MVCRLSDIVNCPWVQSVISNDFKCGYVAATLVFLLIIFMIIVLKIIAFFLFRKPKCSEVEVETENGKLVISSRVISSLVARELSESGRFEDVKVVIRKSGKNYLINIRASYSEGETGLPEISEQLRPQVLELLKTQFGIESVSAMTYQIDRLSEKDEDADTGF